MREKDLATEIFSDLYAFMVIIIATSNTPMIRIITYRPPTIKS